MNVAGYEVVRELGRGGMGLVLLARDASGNEVAIKLLQSLTKDSLLQRFQREERLQALLSEKEGFIPLVTSGEAGEGPYLVMPYLRGGTLRDRLQRGMLELGDALLLLHSLAVALGKAHEAGIVHRDMKPENVVFDEKGKPFVADLGLAKHFRRDLPGGSKSINVTKTGQSLGTTGYMAIEQMRDAQHAGPPADVFALGAILYECLAGRCPPYIGRQPLSALRPELPAWVSEAVERALARDPKDRFADGTAFARALARAEMQLAVSASELPKTAYVPTVLPDTQTRERFVDEVPQEPKRDEPPAGPTSAAPELVSSVPDAIPDAVIVPKTAPRAAVPAPARTWLWIAALVVLGVIAGIVLDRFLR